MTEHDPPGGDNWDDVDRNDFDNLPAELRVLEALASDAAAPTVLRGVRAIGDDGDAARLEAIYDPAEIADLTGAAIAPARPLIGFATPDSRFGGPLVPEIELAVGDVAWLALDPRAIEEVAALDANGLIGDGRPIDIAFRFHLVQEGGGFRTPQSQDHGVRFPLLPTRDGAPIEVVLVPPEDADAGPFEGRFDYRTPDAGLPAAALDLGMLYAGFATEVVARRGVDLLADLTVEALDEFGFEDIAPHVLLVGPGNEPIEHLRITDRGASARVVLLCGAGAFQEPMVERRIGVYARLRRPSDRKVLAQSAVLQAVIAPPGGALGLRATAVDGGEDVAEAIIGGHQQADFGVRESLGPQITPLPLRLLEDLEPLDAGGAPPMTDVIALRLSLEGEMPAGRDSVRVQATADVLDATGEILPGDLLQVTARNANSDAADWATGNGMTYLILGKNSRRGEVRLAMPQSLRAAVEAFGDRFDPDAPLSLRLKLRSGDALRGREICFERSVRLSERRVRRTLAIDLGTTSVAVTLTDDKGQPRMARLGDVYRRYDPTGAGSPYFISSTLGLAEDECWRASDAPQSLWAALDAPTVLSSDPASRRRDRRTPKTLGVRVDPVEAARALERNYAISMPPSRRARGVEDRGADAAGGEEPGAERTPLGLIAGGVGAALLQAPKMKLTASGGAVDVGAPVWSAETDPSGTRVVAVEKAISDALHEIADFYLPWCGLIKEAIEPRLVLTHPARYGVQQKMRLKSAAQALSRRLGLPDYDPADPMDPNAPTLVPESDAVAAYYLNTLPPEGESAVSALVFDLGGGTLDLSLVEAIRTAPEHGARTHGPTVAARGGAQLGGDSIDLVLYFIIHAALEILREWDAAVVYQHDLLAPCEDRGPEARARLQAKRLMAEAIQAAKIDLTARCRAACTDGLYAWPDDLPMRIKVGEIGGRAEIWPVRERRGGAMKGVRADGRPDTAADAGGERLGPGLRLYRRGGDIWLEMSKSAVQRPAMVSLMRFLTQTAVHHVFERDAGRERWPEADYLIVSGRASLWPLIYEGLTETIFEGGVARRLARSMPDGEETLKGAVTLGAISRAADMRAQQRDPGEEHVHYALLVSETELSGEERFQQLIPEADFDKLQGYSGFMRLVEAPPGLTVRDLISDKWAAALIAPTGIGANPRDLDLGPNDPPPRLVRTKDGRVSLQVGGVAFAVDGTRFSHPPALHHAQFDVTEALAPPEYPASTAPARGDFDI